jgi:cytochrome d ubiquinol oxidase subunit II
VQAEELAAAVAVVALIAYAVFGGADFGGGVWTLLASGPRAASQRNALERAIGPVWETNHVWLILLIVTLFVVFPAAYAAIFTALYVPLFLALAGIVARGAAFAFRHYGSRGWRLSSTALRSFSAASVVTPFAFGLVIGGVTDGKVKMEGGRVVSGAFDAWTEPFAVISGVIAVMACGYVAAAFMVPRTSGDLQRDFRVRAIVASLGLGAATTAAILVAIWNAGEFADQLDEADVAGAMGVTATLGMATLWVLWRGMNRAAPALAGATVAGMIVAWALAQNPYLLADELTIQEAAAAGLTVKSFLWSLPVGAVILVPSLYLLYNTFSRETFAVGAEPPGH